MKKIISTPRMYSAQTGMPLICIVSARKGESMPPMCLALLAPSDFQGPVQNAMV